MARCTVSIGPVKASARTKTEATTAATELAASALEVFNRARPFMVEHGGRISIVYPMLMSDGSVEWVYQYPRTLEELRAECPHATDRTGYLGWAGGCYADHLAARSAALMHLIQYEGSIPDPATWPLGMNARDTDTLRSLYSAQNARAAVA